MTADRNSEKAKERAVRDMFGAIAGRYDFLNHFLSGNVDRYWRCRSVREVHRRLPVPNARILDVGCGTADLSIAFSVLGPVVGCDFCHPMLCIGRAKVARASLPHSVELLEGDALNLPFRNESFDVVVSAFVVRNLANIEKGFQEMRRVLKPSGVIGVLEFSMPRVPVLGKAYRFYFLRVLPRLGEWISGVEGAYSYLPASVRSFPPPEELRDRITRAGFGTARFHLLTGGIAVLLTAVAER